MDGDMGLNCYAWDSLWASDGHMTCINDRCTAILDDWR